MIIRISNFSRHIDEVIEIAGWVYNFRSSGSIAFLQIRDGSGFTQAVVSKDEIDEVSWDIVNDMTVETSVKLCGHVSMHPKTVVVFELLLL